MSRAEVEFILEMARARTALRQRKKIRWWRFYESGRGLVITKTDGTRIIERDGDVIRIEVDGTETVMDEEH